MSRTNNPAAHHVFPDLGTRILTDREHLNWRRSHQRGKLPTQSHDCPLRLPGSSKPPTHVATAYCEPIPRPSRVQLARDTLVATAATACSAHRGPRHLDPSMGGPRRQGAHKRNCDPHLKHRRHPPCCCEPDSPPLTALKQPETTANQTNTQTPRPSL